MTDVPNPYQPPASIDERESFWSWIRALFRSPHLRSRDFAKGDPIICAGIAFFIDLEDSTIAYAASPSSDFSEQRMNLIVSEAIRVLPLFLADHPELHAHLRGRNLTVGMFCNDYDHQSGFRRQVPLNWDILNAILSDTPNDETVT
jgi:hypothetical protein